jgi:hypothetical protein
MAYIGKQPVVGNFVKLDAITTSATATYNLLNGGVAYFPQTANNCIVSLNGVIQSPTSAYTISGSTIVFDSALTSADTIDFILVLGDVLSIGTPSDGTVGFSKVTSNLITGATAETSIAGGDSVLIYDDSASALRKMTRTNFVAGIGGTNTPAFKAGRSSSQTISNGTSTTIVFGAEDFDTDSAYDTATGTFTVPTGQGGKYFLYAQYRWQETAIYSSNIEIHKNGSQIAHFGGGNNSSYNSNSIGIVLNLSVADAITIKAFQDSGTNKSITGDANYTYFLGYKLI